MNLIKPERDFRVKSNFLLILFVFIMSAISLNAWKWEQLPDPVGNDISIVYPHQLGDDWLCTSTGPIRTVCFAYSWWNDQIGIIDSVQIRFWSDIPDPDGQGPLVSLPGTLLWDQVFTNYQLCIGGEGSQGWVDPWISEYLYPNHLNYYRCKITVPEQITFIQNAGTIYWLSVSVYLRDPENTKIGWKTTYQPWNDPFAYTLVPMIWEAVPFIPIDFHDLAFRLSDIDEQITCPVELSSFNGTFSTDLCQITWVSESETNVQGYNIYRNTNNLISTATKLNLAMISATNTTHAATYQFQDTDVAGDQTYYYWLEANDYDGASSLFGPISINTLDNNTPVTVPASNLSSVYPNPARSVNPTVDASIKDGEIGVLSIYNLKGQLVNSYNLQSGNHKVEWNKTDSKNHKCADGVYFYRLVTPTTVQSRKILILN